uniref:RAB17, member RAS oncogene family n=1 Tax=Ovis aries TaxID=9940 RepID=A0AC11EHJ5_SHEEP
MAQVDGVLRPGAAPGQPCIFKLVLLGSGSVGKSSLAVRYVKNDFKSILPTVGSGRLTPLTCDTGLGLKSKNTTKCYVWPPGGF